MSTQKPSHQAVVFQSPRGKKEWYWHVKAIRGGKIICSSGEGFSSRATASNALKGALKVMGNATAIETVVEPSLDQKKAAAEKAKKAKAKTKAKKTARKATAKKSAKTRAAKPTPAKKTTKAPTATKKAKKTTSGKEIQRSKVKAKKTAKKPQAKRAKKLSVVDGGKQAA